MKYGWFCIFLLVTTFAATAQPLLHAHNDYQQPEPLTHALRQQVFSLEADIYLSGGRLLVAHTKNELATAPSLDSMYLQPIIALFRRYGGRISANKKYAPVLMIDIKQDGEAVIARLIQLLSPYASIFDRSVNARAVQIVLSGDRGAVSKWSLYAPSIFFDGRPYEVYDSATLQRVAFISDNYTNYISPQDSTTRLQQLVKKVHGIGKLLRLWGCPDTPAWWKQQQQWGVDIINTDKVAECREYFLKR